MHRTTEEILTDCVFDVQRALELNLTSMQREAIYDALWRHWCADIRDPGAVLLQTLEEIAHDLVWKEVPQDVLPQVLDAFEQAYRLMPERSLREQRSSDEMREWVAGMLAEAADYFCLRSRADPDSCKPDPPTSR
jgi:hypothetical protein